RKRGLYDKAIIVLMSDHGEGLYEHGEPEHGIFLYREAIHVPLIVKLPAGAQSGRTVTRPVGLVDIMPTILSLTGIKPPAHLDGASLLAPNGSPSRRIYSETLYPRIHLGWSELRSVEDGRYHFIRAPAPELYDMERDPGEKMSVLSEERRIFSSMRAEIDQYGGAIDLPKQIDPEEAKKLTALGYLGSSVPATAGPLPDPKDRIGEVAAMVEAMRLSTEQKNAEAIAAFRAILAKNPRLADAWNQLALTLEASGRYEEAADAYRSAIQLTPELAGEFGLSLGSVLLKLDRLDDAAAHARLGEKVNPGGARVLLARVALAKKDYRKAEEEARTARNDPYARLAATVLLAQILASEERAPEAYALADEAGKMAERQGEGAVESLDFVRGDALARMQRYDEAIAAFGREITNFPRNKQAYANLALVHMLTNRPAEARSTLDKMLQANPNRRAYLFAAHTLETLNDPHGAAAMRRQAEKLK
ncbi:MAG TPA: tetratricopeptide repeat protein, partial [Thermoanaerobaculia bacterium]|nr:tetratricopeptide repeat protein [Thermoanaerobaculia bacterium]